MLLLCSVIFLIFVSQKLIKTWFLRLSTCSPSLFLSECSCFNLLVLISHCQMNMISPTSSFNNHFLFSQLSNKCSNSYETFHICLKSVLIWHLNKHNFIEGPKLSNENRCWKIIAINNCKGFNRSIYEFLIKWQADISITECKLQRYGLFYKLRF